MLVRRLCCVLLVVVSACGGGGGGGGSPEPPVQPNDAPAIQVPGQLSGGPVSFRFVLPIAGSETLMFQASDPNGDALLWQVAVAGAGQAATGVSFASPATGNTFSIALAPVTEPAATTLSVLVEDPRGAAAAVDVLIVRSGPPTIASVAPTSAFATAPQRVAITGSAFLLGGAVNTTASFGGIAAADVAVLDDTTLTCTTPAPGLLGANAVSVAHTYGSATLPAGSFAMYAYPVDRFATDLAFDGGAGGNLVAANDGPRMHALWIEAGALWHRRSLDAGATWSMAQMLSAGELPSEPRVVVVGDNVTAVWIGDGQNVWQRSSMDGGATFAVASALSQPGTGPVTGLRLSASAARRYCAWLSGDAAIGQQRVVEASSADAGATWQPAAVVFDGGSNQSAAAIGCDGANCWIAYYNGAAGEPGVYTSFSNDGGILWTAGVRRSAVSNAITEVLACNDGPRAWLVYVDNGVLRYLQSQDAGDTWTTQAVVLNDTSLGAVTLPTVACAADRLYAAYVASGNAVAFSRVGAAGAVPETVVVSDTTEEAGRPVLAARGNYVLCAFRGGAIGGGIGPARIKLVSSVDLGATFSAPSVDGDGASAQEAPQLLLDGARIWLGWRDHRGPTPALFHNRTEQ